MKSPKFYTIDKVTPESGDACIQLPRNIRVRNVEGAKAQIFEVLCSFARLIPGAKITRKKSAKASRRGE